MVTSLNIGDPATRVGKAVSGVSRTRTLHTYEINGVALRAYDEEGSLTADRVAGELWQDIYGLDAIPFQPGDCVIDIGAHIGLVSMYLAKRWPFLRIHAFEPHFFPRSTTGTARRTFGSTTFRMSDCSGRSRVVC